MRIYVIKFLILAVCILVGIVIGKAALLWFDPNWHGYPAITRCEICGKRIWAWQDYERRQFKVHLDNPTGCCVSVRMSGLVHCNCQGIVEREVKIWDIVNNAIRVTTSQLGVKELIEVDMPVEEQNAEAGLQ
jgi:hypothetical protein